MSMKRLAILSILVVLLLICLACVAPQSPESSSLTTNAPQSPSSSPLTTSTMGKDDDRDDISGNIEEELLQRFAPLVRLHPDDNYRPASIPWYLPRVRMRFNVNWGFDDQILIQGMVDTTTLVTQSNRDQFSGLALNGTDFFLEQTDVSGGDSLDGFRNQTRRGADPSDWVCYAHVRPASEPDRGMYDIQYIFFYPYNGDMAWGQIESAHEADFEHITVRVEDDLRTIHGIYYSAHDEEGRWYTKETSTGVEDGYSLTTDGRPIVYSALDSHASYPWSGDWIRDEKPDDFTRDGGPEWDCLTNIVNLGEKAYPMRGANWLQYSGRWGEIGELSWTTGPYGPAYQDWWNADP
jgi:hypothetical protein